MEKINRQGWKKIMASYLLAHDLGTSGNKATLFTTDGVLVESTVYSYGLNVSAGHRAEQNADDWWRAVCETTRQLIEKAGIAPSDIDAVSFSGHMMGCLCVDEHGVPVRDSLIWADLRSSEEENHIRRQMSDADYYHLTGQRLSASYSAPKLMPMGALTYAIACSHCKNRESSLCEDCVCEVTSGFELDPDTLPAAPGIWLAGKDDLGI
jgi:sugar (pentulose or hexulose) kinase